MKKLTYKTLMKRVDEGRAEIDTWASERCNYAEVIFYRNIQDRGRRETVEVTNVPAELGN